MNETAHHLELKRRALAWAQQHGYRIASAEVGVPLLAARLDVAGFRPERLNEPCGDSDCAGCRLVGFDERERV